VCGLLRASGSGLHKLLEVPGCLWARECLRKDEGVRGAGCSWAREWIAPQSWVGGGFEELETRRV
jgi:hypothetical protein